ncbi:hypothetical protein ACI2KR_08145 [Pseudomonas luteola]
MKNVTEAAIKEFVYSLDRTYVMVSRRDLADKFQVKHCRSGKVDGKCEIKEARGKAVHAYGFDEVGNVIALCADGHIRQFINS